jgi:hypothetical protein
MCLNRTLEARKQGGDATVYPLQVEHRSGGSLNSLLQDVIAGKADTGN